MSKLVVVVPIGRAFCGRAYVVGTDGVTRAGPFRALGTASARVAKKHGNTACSVLFPFGHPPCGTYVIAASLPPGYAHKKRARRFGRVGGLLLSPTTGDALRATSNGRKLVAIHGGPRDTKRRLRPTRGGVRLSNTHMHALLAAINDAQRAADPVSSVEILEIDMQLARKRDRRGSRKVAKKKATTQKKEPAPGSGVTSMMLLPFVLGGAGKSPVARRELLRAAAIAFGALAIQACDRPSRCSPLACYPDDAGDGGDAGDAGDGGDAGCKPQGYVCDPHGGVG